MTIREVQDSIRKMKKEKNICILAHAYQSRDIWETADYVGDSFGLSLKAEQSDADTIIMCGVRFMAETVKLLSPQKRVFLPNSTAGCPMADQVDFSLLMQTKSEYPDHTFVAYINTSAEVKQLCDVCVTSSSAVKIIRNIENDRIFFLPDCNLGDWVAKQVPEKKIELMRGGCPTHLRINQRDIDRARMLYPDGLMLVHPECHPSVVSQADFVGSTTEIIEYAEKSDNKEFIIGTENSIAEHLQFSCPDKKFIPLSKDCVCHNMSATTLMDVYNCVKDKGGEEIIMSEELIRNSRKCIDEMLRLGK